MKKAINLFVIFVVVSLCACDSSHDGQKTRADQYLKSANQLAKQGQLRAALVQSKNVLQVEPESESGYLQIARIYNQIGYYTETEALLRNKLDVMPGLAYELAVAYFQRKKYKSALDVLSSSSVQQDQAFRLLKAVCYLHLGELQEYEKEVTNIASVSRSDGYLVAAEGEAAKLQNDLDGAEKKFLQITNESPLYVDALTYLADIYIAQAKFDLAEKKLTEALSLTLNADTLTVQKAKILTTMVQMLVQQGRSGEAYTYQKMLANANPELDFMKGRFDEALEFYAQGDIDRARSVLVDLHQSFPNNSNVTTLLGVIAFQQGKDQEAEAYLAQVIDPETATPGLIQASSILKARNNKIDDAIELLKAAVKAQPRNAQLLATYGLALLQKDPLDKEGAMALEKSIAMDSTQQRLRLALADRHYRLSEEEQGFAQLESAFRNAPLDSLITQNYFRQLLLVAGDKAVLKEIASLKEKFPKEPQVVLAEAWWLFELKRYAEVEKALTRAMDSFPQAEKMSAYLLLSDVYSQQKKPEAARKVLEEYLRDSPQSSSVYEKWLGLVGSAQLSTAINFLQELQAADETAWQPYFYRGVLNARNGNWDEATTALDHVLQKTAQTSVRQQILSVYNARGFQLVQSGDMVTAQTVFLKVLGIDANDRTALYYYVQIALRSNQIPEAKKIIEQADKNTAIYEFISGLVREHEAGHEQALKHFRAAWAKDAFDLYAEKLYGIYTAQKDKAAVKNLVTDWVGRLPNSSQAILLSAMLKQEEGLNDEAITLYEKLLTLMPANVVALNNLAWLYLDQDLAKAEVLAKKAVDLAPDSVEVLDTYAWILYKNNKPDEALSVIQKASEAAPDNATLKEHLDVIQQAANAN